LILDGGMASEIQRRGFAVDGDPLWSARALLEAPERVREVHRSYLRAGAEVITTAGYQVSFEGFERAGLGAAECERSLRLSVRLALEERDRHGGEALVAASLGPWGAMLADGSEYRGDYEPPAVELLDFHRRRARILADEGADLLAFETVPQLREASLIASVLRSEALPPSWISFSCAQGASLPSGELLADAVELVVGHAAPAILGVNCTAPPQVSAALAALSGAPVPKVVYPNLGEDWDGTAGRWTGGSGGGDWTELAPGWVAAGARVLGGCCRTTPEQIRRLRETLSDVVGD
jgi:homocysteine S-methyltransferase